MRAQKRDSNEPSIVEALELMGYRVERHYTPDPFDLLVRRINSPVGLCLEVKMPNGTLKDSQTEALEEGAIVIVRSPDEAVEAANRYL
jgi:hypothetical protein